MNIILFTDAPQGMGTTLEQRIQNQLPRMQVEIVDSIGLIAQRLCRPLNGISVIILFIASESQIEQLLAIQPFFDDIRLILIFPDTNRTMMAKGLQLDPCFISYLHSDLNDITSVLEKIETLTNETQPMK